MHANRNKGAIKKVEKGMMKANRIRNTFAVLAVVLTTFMITTVFSLGINYMENMELMQVRTAGTSADVSLALPTTEQEQQIRALDYVKTIGTQYMVGSVAEKNDEGRELSIALQYYDTTEWENHYQDAINNINGSYPTQENEIMLSEDALAQLGIEKPILNMEIPLSYYDKNGQQERTFTLSGWFHSYTGVGMGFVSESYCTNAGYTLQEDGVLSLSLNKMPDDFFQIQDNVQLNEDQAFHGAVSMSSSNGSVIAMVILLVLFIVGSGYLLIYNVLYISISKDTRFYGLMKTIGTTQKQIKSLVKKQALKFACIGIPVGIVLAAAVSIGAVLFMESTSALMLFVICAFGILCGLLFLLDFLHNRYHDDLLEQITLLIEALVEQQERIVFPENEDTLTARLQHQLLKLRNILTAQNQMLAQEKEQIKTLISDISHQIKTPVAAANTFAQLLDDKELSDEERSEYIATLQTSLEKLTFLTNSLIKMSRLESGMISLKPEKNNLNDIILQAVKTVYAKAKEKNITITFDCVQNFEAVLDFNWTAEAITNVLDNAVKYTPSGGIVGLEITEYPSYLRLDISDNGIGIPEEEQAKIFGRFYRGKYSAGIDGVGIGLYLTRDIIQKQHGYIKVRSDKNGSSFSVFVRKNAAD